MAPKMMAIGVLVVCYLVTTVARSSSPYGSRKARSFTRSTALGRFQALVLKKSFEHGFRTGSPTPENVLRALFKRDLQDKEESMSSFRKARKRREEELSQQDQARRDYERRLFESLHIVGTIQPTRLYVREDPNLVPVGTVVGKVRKLHPHGKVLIVWPYKGFRNFTLNEDTGEVTTTDKMDFEFKRIYNMTIRDFQYNYTITDPQRQPPKPNPPNSLYIDHYLIVEVVDLNDNKPIFQRDSGSSQASQFFGKVNRNARAGTKILKLYPIDDDSGPRGRIRFKIVTQGSEETPFTIDPQTHWLKTNGQELETKTYTVNIEALDYGMPPKTSGTQQVKVEVSADKPYFVDGQTQSHNFSEASVRGSVIATVTAISRSGIPVDYRIEGDADKIFAINHLGQITLLREFDYDTANDSDKSFEFVVRAKEVGDEGESNRAKVTLHLVNADDHLGKFKTPATKLRVKEGSKSTGEDLFTVEIEDCDCKNKQTCICGSNEMIFTLGDTKGFFDITKDGQIRNIKDLDYETKSYFFFPVNVTDPGTNGRTRTSYIEVYVEDMDDTPPIFPVNEYKFYIFEDAPKDQVVGVAQAVDPDPSTKPNDVQYSITSVKPPETRSYFYVANQGVIKVLLKDTKNFAGSDKYEMVIKATDKLGSESVPPATVIINILDVNDHQPVFTSSCKEQKIKENQKIGTVVTTLKATDNDRGLNKEIEYSIQPVQKHNFFAIDKTTGVVTTTAVLDRESYDTIFVIAKATDGGPTRSDPLRQVGYCQFIVELEDVNDHYPEFTVIQFTVTIKRSHPLDTLVLFVEAVDPDVGDNAKIEYEIFSQKLADKDVDYFKVVKTTGELKTKKSVSGLSKTDKVTVVIQAKNTVPVVENTPLTTFSKTTVTVSFTDGQIPQFTQSRYVKNDLKEDIATNTAVLNLAVKGSSKDILFSLQSQIRNRDNLPFYVETSTGAIKTTKTLNYEEKKSYLFAVTAEYDTYNAMTSAIVQINIGDVDDEVPIFGNDRYEATISEAAKPGTNVFRIKATDRDPVNGGSINYVLQKQYNYATFEVVQVKDYAQIKIAKNLKPIDKDHTEEYFDREKKDSYTIIVEAYRGSNTKLKSTASVSIKVRDENDSPPKFKQELYTATVKEALSVPYIVPGINVSATDDDLLENANVTYFITSGNDGRFEMETKFGKDQNNYGLLKIVRPLDYEKTPEFSNNPVYNLTVTATDRKHTAIAYVVIKVEDRPEDRPEFVREFYEKYLPENVGPGVPVVKVEVTKPAGVLFYLGDIAKPYFVIDEITGLITTYGELLDWEITPIITFPVFAYVKGNRNDTGQTFVRVLVNDVNDAPPIFPNQPYIGYVSENSTIGTTVRYINGIDLDNPELNNGNNVRLSYEILRNIGRDPYDKDAKLFNFTSNGLLVTKEVFDLEKLRRNLTIRIRAWDHGTPRLYGETDVTIVVLDVNEEKAEFRKREYFATVSETQPPGFVVLQLSVKDEDFSERDNFAFSMLEGNNPYAFDIKQETGEIVVAGVLDYEGKVKKREYVLKVGLMERDKQFMVPSSVIGQFTPFQDAVKVTIKILPGNDHRPSFTKPSKKYATSVAEDVKVGTELKFGQPPIEAVDNDIGTSNAFTFLITKGNEGDWFGIKKDPKDSNKAIVFIQYPVDREYRPVYDMELIVKDHSGAYDTAMLTVTVTDINDNPPIFHPSYYRAEIKENGCTATKALVTLLVTDPDKEPHGPFAFEFAPKGNPGSAFELRDTTDNTTKLYCTGSINREANPNPVVIVKATDNSPDQGAPKLSSTAKVFIHVRDADEYTAKNGKMTIIVNAIDGKFEGGAIGMTYFDDDDGEGDSTMRYSIISDSGDFYVRKEDGLISAKSTVRVGKYQLRIQGVKGGNRPICTAEITIRHLPMEAIENSAAIQFNNVLSPSTFMNPVQISNSNNFEEDTHYNVFVEMLSRTFGVGIQDVFVFTIQESAKVFPGKPNPGIDVRFAIRKPSSAKSNFLPKEILITTLERKTKKTLEDTLGFKIDMIGVDYCVNETLRIGKCNNVAIVNEKDKYSVVSSDYGYIPAPKYAMAMVSVNLKMDGVYARYKQDPDPEYDKCIKGVSCLNGGICHDVTPHGFVCECPGKYSGPRCQITTRTFDGDSYIWLPPKTPHNYGGLSFEFATHQATALLLYQGPAVAGGNNGHKDFLAVSLVKGKIKVGLSFGGKPIKFELEQGARLNDGKWHHISITHERKDVTLTVDNCKHADIVEDDERIVELRTNCEIITKTDQNFEYLNGQDPIQVGGIENMPLQYPTSEYIEYSYFTGCIRKITENLEMYDLGYPVKVVNSPIGCTIMAKCPDCKNGGYCSPGFSRSVCTCTMGYVGDDCSGQAPRFNYLPNSFTEYKLPGEERRRKRGAAQEPGDLLDRYAMHIAMQLRINPDVDKAMFFYSSSETNMEYSILGYEDQKLYFEFKLLDALTRLEMPGNVKVADGSWHNITVTREGNFAVLQVDYTGRVSRNTGGAKKLIRMASAKLYVGGMPSIAPNATIVNKTVEALITDIRFRRRRRSAGTILGVTTDGREVSSVGGDMTGCTGGSSYNGKNVDTDPNIKKIRFNVEMGCPCRAVLTCYNNGWCVSADIPYCQCTPGWTGPTCEDIVYVARVLGNRVDGRARWQDGGVLVVILCVVLCILILAVALAVVKKRREAPYSVPVGDEGQDSIMPYHDDGAGEEDTFNYDIHHLMKYSFRDGHGTVTKEVNGKEIPLEEMELLHQAPGDLGMAGGVAIAGGGGAGGVGYMSEQQMAQASIDMWPFILERVQKADEDLSWWPQDEMVHWAEEGDEEEAADLSEIEEEDDEGDVEQDWDFLKDWGKKFENLNKIFNPDDDDDEDETEA